jgi:hypothetical protein
MNQEIRARFVFALCSLPPSCSLPQTWFISDLWCLEHTRTYCIDLYKNVHHTAIDASQEACDAHEIEAQDKPSSDVLRQANANKQTLGIIREGVQRLIKEATQHASILDVKIEACDEVIHYLEKLMSFPPPPPVSPEQPDPEPAGGTSII